MRTSVIPKTNHDRGGGSLIHFLPMRRLLPSIIFALSSLLSLTSCDEGKTHESELALIPMPLEVMWEAGHYQLGKSPTVTIELPESESLLSLLSEALAPIGSTPVVKDGGDISLYLDNQQADEGYSLEVSDRGIRIWAASAQGARYAIQTLRQMIEPNGRVHHVKINDAPRFAYRGIMLDVSRHMVSKEYIKSLLDEMSRLKFNTLHWHLVDGGGWRMESEAYPLLTKKAAWRTESDWDTWWRGLDRQFVDEGTPGAYGGYYTKADIREIVAYASKLGITIMPEIEMPGHSNEIFFAYPEIFCKDTYEHGITDVCIGNEETFKFFEAILLETMDLFPSKYIHIGGDEAAMNHWGDCPKCQARMKAEGLKELPELQSYMIRRIETFLINHGRRLVGWDEILMGGLAPEATVMSWRGEEGGIAAAKAGHDVIMTPNSHFYLDYYQSIAPNQPRSNSSFVPLEKVYSYNPEPEGLTPEERKHILGIQANLWTEYATSEDLVDYMLYPRMLAVSEVAWNPSGRDWQSFRKRASAYTDGLIERGRKAYTLNGVSTDIRPSQDSTQVVLTLEAERPDVELRYTLDGTAPTATSTLYTAPIATADSADIRLNLYRNGQPLYEEARPIRIDRHLGMDATSITYVNEANSKYPAQGPRTLIDGQRGTPTYTDGLWLGFTRPLDVTIDLGSLKPVSHIYAQFMQEREHWVWMPEEIEVWLSSDGTEWTSLGRQTTKIDPETPRTLFETYHFYAPRQEARYVRMYAKNRSFAFTDEIVIQ